MTAGAMEIALTPLLPWPWTAALCAALAVAAGLVLALRARGAGWRTAALAALALALVNPTLVAEDREPRKDVAVVVVDASPSQRIGERGERTRAALEHLRGEFERFEDVELRVVRAGGRKEAEAGGAPVDGTYLFKALGQALADVPRGRVAGAVMITDGQVHDAPKADARLPLDAPLHVLLSGEKDERDRRLVVEKAPRFGLVGQNLEITIKVDDGEGAGGSARLTARKDSGEPLSANVPVGVEAKVSLPIDHRGENVFEMEVERGPHELTMDNNRAVVVVNGVRDRLRVLLVSGEPYAGERVWRNLLKSDPSVDLIHFTILRPPEKQDGTPVSELSLIAFPIRELFEVKLDEFDLVIFDHYRRRGLLPREYVENIVQYVRRGGALLEAAGPYFSTALSLYRTPLGDVLPAEPTGAVRERGFTPEITELGRRHPVTAGLDGAGGEGEAPQWGRWFRHIDADARAGHTLMAGIDERPLLLLRRIEEGRVAQLLSDQIWLWARGYEGGGPQAELLRRLAHWLMKEPELEENRLSAQVQGNRMEIERRSLEPTEAPVSVTAPSGNEREVKMTQAAPGRDTAAITVSEAGIYRLADGERQAVAAVGTLAPVEFEDVRTTAGRVRPAVEKSGGGIAWLADEPTPDLRRVRPGREAAGRPAAGGRGWIGLNENRNYVVAGIREVPLLPAIAVMALVLGLLGLAWRREGM